MTKFEEKLRELLREFYMEATDISFVFIPNSEKQLLAIKYEDIEL